MSIRAQVSKPFVLDIIWLYLLICYCTIVVLSTICSFYLSFVVSGTHKNPKYRGSDYFQHSLKTNEGTMPKRTVLGYWFSNQPTLVPLTVSCTCPGHRHGLPRLHADVILSKSIFTAHMSRCKDYFWVFQTRFESFEHADVTHPTRLDSSTLVPRVSTFHAYAVSNFLARDPVTISFTNCHLDAKKGRNLNNKNNVDSVQGGIALTSPPCHNKQTSGLTIKVRSVYQTNCEMAVVKAAL